MTSDREERIEELKIKLRDLRGEISASQGAIDNVISVHRPIVDRLKAEEAKLEAKLNALRSEDEPTDESGPRPAA